MPARKTNEQFLKEVFELVGDEYTFLDEYEKSNTKILVRHNCNKCDNYEYMVRPTDFRSGYRCPKCAGCIKKTDDDFKKEVDKLVKSEYTFLEPYINSGTKIRVMHNCDDCGNNVFEMPPNHFLAGQRCPKCSKARAGIAMRKTHEEFSKEVFDKVGDEYDVVGKYIKDNAKITFRHNVCGYEYNTKPNSFINGNRCPKCSGRVRKDFNYFANEVFDLVGDEYTVFGEYVNTDVKIGFTHKDCGHSFDMTPANFLKGQRCPSCAGVMRLDTKVYKERILNLTNGEYLVKSDYKTSRDKVTMLHVECGTEWDVTPINFYHNGSRCPNCFGARFIDSKIFQDEMNEVSYGEYTLLSEYKGLLKKVDVKHNLCGNIWSVSPSGFMHDGTRCPKCRNKISKGEKAIWMFLEESGIEFKYQESFEECKNIAKLPFDFSIYKDGEIAMLIEYDGLQHFGEIGYFGGKDGFLKRVMNDEIKNDFCKTNNIKLIRIPYWDFDDIDGILYDALVEDKLIIDMGDVI